MSNNILTPMRLDRANVPEVLWPLIRLAEQFGFEDDQFRQAAIQGLSPEMAHALKKFVSDHEPHFDAWLAGPESECEEVSAEYVAFSYLRIAAEEAREM